MLLRYFESYIVHSVQKEDNYNVSIFCNIYFLPVVYRVNLHGTAKRMKCLAVKTSSFVDLVSVPGNRNHSSRERLLSVH